VADEIAEKYIWTSINALIMNNTNLAARIKDLRNRKGFSQELLSENSQLSLRTIQRIEKGESTPRGDTLVRLTQALGVTPDDLLEWTEQEDKGYLTLMNFSALASLIFNPVLGIVIPAVMWIYKRDKVKHVDDYGKKIINFQITWVIVISTIFIALTKNIYLYFFNVKHWILTILTALIHGNYDITSVELFGPLIMTFLYLYSLVLILKNYARIRQGKEAWYKPAIPFLR